MKKIIIFSLKICFRNDVRFVFLISKISKKKNFKAKIIFFSKKMGHYKLHFYFNLTENNKSRSIIIFSVALRALKFSTCIAHTQQQKRIVWIYFLVQVIGVRQKKLKKLCAFWKEMRMRTRIFKMHLFFQ